MFGPGVATVACRHYRIGAGACIRCCFTAVAAPAVALLLLLPLPLPLRLLLLRLLHADVVILDASVVFEEPLWYIRYTTSVVHDAFRWSSMDLGGSR